MFGWFGWTWRVMAGRAVIGILGVLLGTTAMAWDGVVYRWFGADGRVNYGSQPPAGVRAEVLGARGTVSVLPAPVVPAADTAATEARLQRLEAELEEERRLRREAEAAAAADLARRERLRVECEERLREPCDEAGRPLGPRYLVVPARPAPRPGVRPFPPAGPAHPPREGTGPRGRDEGPKPVLPIETPHGRASAAADHPPERRGAKMGGARTGGVRTDGSGDAAVERR